MKTGFGTELDSKPAPAAAIAAAVALIAVVVATAIAWAVPKSVAAGNRIEAASRAPVTETYGREEPAASSAILTEEAGKARKPLCAQCGVIEAVQRIDTPLHFTGWCDATEFARTQNSGMAYGRDFRVDREPLPESVAAALAAGRNTTKDVVTTRHRIVVRLRNGSRQVFEEATPRMVHVGDRMVVIAGAQRASG